MFGKHSLEPTSIANF